MTKLFWVLVLVSMLTSCSEYITKKLENCADVEYSKEVTKPANIYFHLMNTKIDPYNEFEKNVRLLKASGSSHGSVIDYVRNKIDSPEKAPKGFEDTIRRYDNEIRKFLNLSLDKKLKKSPIINYEYLFTQCELIQREKPITFNALWKKAEIQYVGDKIK